MRTLFGTAEFQATRGAKLKRPFHFVISALRATNAQTDGAQPLLDYLLRMGHAPFRYPTPDGYPIEASHWTSTLLWRWNFAAALTENKIKGTKVSLAKLREKVGGDDALMAMVLGRKPSEQEVLSYHQSGVGVALLLSSPGFQRC